MKMDISPFNTLHLKEVNKIYIYIYINTIYMRNLGNTKYDNGIASNFFFFFWYLIRYVRLLILLNTGKGNGVFFKRARLLYLKLSGFFSYAAHKKYSNIKLQHTNEIYTP